MQWGERRHAGDRRAHFRRHKHGIFEMWPTCHLGNGCSAAAIQGGRSIDTTMGFTPLDGLMMGTRSGAVDPGIFIFLMRQARLDDQKIDHVLNQESGLLGISGLSGDMRDILVGIQRGHERAKLAFDIYIHRLRAAIGSMAAVLGGMEAVVFTAGVGENSADVRAAGAAHWNSSVSKLIPN
jgi:acetate kinase